jgi:AMP nucleosidase
MKTKKDIVKDWITRYSGIKITAFKKFILLTNFQKYVDEFAIINMLMALISTCHQQHMKILQ